MIQLMYYYAYTNIKVLYHIKVVQTLTFSGIKCPVPCGALLGYTAHTPMRRNFFHARWSSADESSHFASDKKPFFLLILPRRPATSHHLSNPLTSHETVLTLFPSSGKDLVQPSREEALGFHSSDTKTHNSLASNYKKSDQFVPLVSTN
jgi:hypothetical protein